VLGAECWVPSAGRLVLSELCAVYWTSKPGVLT
jgi:hypothetical protein